MIATIYVLILLTCVGTQCDMEIVNHGLSWDDCMTKVWTEGQFEPLFCAEEDRE